MEGSSAADRALSFPGPIQAHPTEPRPVAKLMLGASQCHSDMWLRDFGNFGRSMGSLLLRIRSCALAGTLSTSQPFAGEAWTCGQKPTFK